MEMILDEIGLNPRPLTIFVFKVIKSIFSLLQAKLFFYDHSKLFLLESLTDNHNYIKLTILTKISTKIKLVLKSF